MRTSISFVEDDENGEVAKDGFTDISFERLKAGMGQINDIPGVHSI